jgi:hypothetical protein
MVVAEVALMRPALSRVSDTVPDSWPLTQPQPVDSPAALWL